MSSMVCISDTAMLILVVTRWHLATAGGWVCARMAIGGAVISMAIGVAIAQINIAGCPVLGTLGLGSLPRWGGPRIRARNTSGLLAF
jgi:hypothetical protein